MSNLDSWILIPKTLLDTLWDQAHPADPAATIPDNVKLLSRGVRGFWKDSGSDEVVNLLAPKEELDQFMLDHGLTTRYDWTQGNGLDALDSGYPTVPAEVLALMKDHPGEIISSGELPSDDIVYGPPIPATLENPDFGHSFFGQKDRIFAGDFDNDFDEDFF